MDLPLGVVTVWYSGSENIDRFVFNKKRILKPDLLHVHVINYLEDAAEKRLRVAFPEALFINVGNNIGTAGAWNLAIELLHKKGVNTVAIWNPDVELAEDCLSTLATILHSDKGIGAVCPLILFSHDRRVVQFFGGSVTTKTGQGSHDYRGVRNIASLPRLRDADFLDGGTMMVKLDAIRRVGMFDERLFIYDEDTDLCKRLQKAGFRTVAVRDAIAWHYHAEHRKDGKPMYEVFYCTRNMFYLARKHGTRFAWIRFLIRSLWLIPRKSVSHIHHNAYHLLIPLWAGAFCGIFGIMGKRGWVK